MTDLPLPEVDDQDGLNLDEKVLETLNQQLSEMGE